MEMEISWNLYRTLEKNLHLPLHSYSTLYPLQVNLMCMPLGCGRKLTQEQRRTCRHLTANEA